MTDFSISPEGKKHIALIVGQHSPLEMLGAHFLMPMIRYLAEHKQLLEKFVISFVPIVNVDCAHWGGDGFNVNKQNTNRCWFSHFQPETEAVKRYFLKLKKSGINLDLFFDIHGGGGWKKHVLLKFSDALYREKFGPGADELIARKKKLLQCLQGYAGLRRKDSLDFPYRHCCAQDFFQTAFPHALALTMELGVTSYHDPVRKMTLPFSQESLAVVGNGIIKAVIKYFNAQGDLGVASKTN